jgi:hypothetical protein
MTADRIAATGWIDPASGRQWHGDRAVWEAWRAGQPALEQRLLDLGTDPASTLGLLLVGLGAFDARGGAPSSAARRTAA